MICPICKQRWAPLVEGFLHDVEAENRVRERLHRNNKIRCCGSDECLKVVDAMENTSIPTLKTYAELVEETQKELAEGKIK